MKFLPSIFPKQVGFFPSIFLVYTSMPCLSVFR
ncbi:hypothetical protein MMJ09_20200, partial [Bacillus vallismortis]|nr:hypothetical protein [Bacillus vallismortis]